MKYILKKEYPGSPKLGNIIDNLENDWIENYPEFWKLVVEKNYEILSVITNNNKFIEKVYNQDATIEPYWKIHSVKRLSDGEIFTVGDIIDTRVDNKYKQEILEINLGINDLLLKDKLIFKTKSGYVVSHIAVKVKQPLCTTEDGVDIYLGNKSWILHKNSWYLSPAAIVHNNSNWTPNENEAHWRFSTKEKAEEYILMNKPCLSLKDVASIYISADKPITDTTSYSAQNRRIQDLVKSKIQQSV